MNSESWIVAFQAVLSESDPAQLPQKISAAKNAILDRIEELHGANADSARDELRTALQTLGVLESSPREPRVGL